MVLYKRAQGVRIEQKKLRIRKKENEFVSRERVWVTVKTKTEKLAVGFVYVASENRSERNKERFNQWNTSIYEVLEEDVRKLRKEDFKVILNGDMNGWVGCGPQGIPGNRKEINSNGLRFMDFLDKTGMIHLNGTSKCTGLYTRHSSKSSTVLDYVSVSKEDLPMVKSVFVDENSLLGGNSDHVYVITTLEYVYSSGPARTTKTRSATKWDMNEETDWTRFREVQKGLMKNIPSEDWGSAASLGETLNKVLVTALEERVGKKGVKEQKPKLLPAGVRKQMSKMKEKQSEWRAARSRMTKQPSMANKQEMIEKEIKMEREKDKFEEAMNELYRGERSGVFDRLAEGGQQSTKLFW